MITIDNQTGHRSTPRRQFLRQTILAAGVTIVPTSVFAQSDKSMTNKYALYGKLQAQAGKGAELGKILLKAAALMENAKGCILYIVSKSADNPDGVYIIEVWQNKEDHDNSLKVPGVRELITQARPILAGPPEGVTLEVLGGKGIG